jgi:P27 family predicted phage terminase small subunit
LKRLANNPGRRKIRETPEPGRLVEVPKPPAWLDVQAKAKFQELAPQLVKHGLLTPLGDVDALSTYCQAWAEVIEATRILKKSGRVQTTRNGYAVVHPAVGMQRSAMAALKAAGAQLGLDTASRTRLQVKSPADEADDPIAELLRRKAEDDAEWRPPTG